MNKRYQISRIILIFLTLFIGIGALLGAFTMFYDPTGLKTGMAPLLDGLKLLPFADVLFTNLLFSGIALLIVNGIPNIIAAVLLFLKKKAGSILGLILGITLMMWITIQFFIFETNPLSTSFFIIGFLQLITGIINLIGYLQSEFSFNQDIYQNIGTNKDTLVIFFSRNGYTKKLAYELADEQGADILEIKTKEKIAGNLGFWWCGRFGMHKWEMALEDYNVDFKNYSTIIICTPIWVFNICAPIRAFCKNNAGKIKNVNYVITHFMNCKFENAAHEMDNLLDTKHNSFRTFCCRYGKVKEIES